MLDEIRAASWWNVNVWISDVGLTEQLMKVVGSPLSLSDQIRRQSDKKIIKIGYGTQSWGTIVLNEHLLCISKEVVMTSFYWAIPLIMIEM